jgi:hypothetical protein
MELGTQGHGVNHDGLLLRVVVEDHDLEKPAGAVRANDEIPSVAWDDSYRVSDCVLHVFVEDAVPMSAVGDLHHDKVALSGPLVKAALSTCVQSALVPEASMAPRSDCQIAHHGVRWWMDFCKASGPRQQRSALG